MSESSKVNCNDVIDALAKENIEARRLWNPMHLQPLFREYKFFSSHEGVSVGEDLFNRGVCLPSDTKMSDEDLKRVIDIVKSVVERLKISFQLL